MHNCALIALPAKSDERLFAWSVKATDAGRIEVTDIATGRRLDDPWTRVCMERVYRVADGNRTAVELVLCPIGDELVRRRDIDAFGNLLSTLRQSAWGARLFIALSTRIQLTQELLQSKATLELWLDTARRARVADLFHIDYDPWELSSISPSRLWEAICSTEPRRELLASLFPSSRPWCCVQRAKPGVIATLFGMTSARTLSGSDLVLVVDEADPDFQCHYVETNAARFREHQLIVVTLSAPPSQELIFLCREQRLLPPISMNGELELYFFLLRLNSTRAELPAPTRRIAPVQRPAPHPVFLPPISSPTVLFTSAFDESERDDCVAAAGDLGLIFANVPVDLPLHVEPLITLSRLATVLDENPELNIWIHSGHGEPYGGLREAGVDGSARVRQWLHCFGSQKIRLELAVFLTCYSAPVARQFARAGAGVAVGFEGKVNTDTARLVAAGLLTGVIQGGLRRDVILHCLVRGMDRFEGIDWSQSKPKAYYLPRR